MKPEEPTTNHVSRLSPDKNKQDLEDGEISSEEETLEARRKSERETRRKSDKRQRVLSSVSESNTESAVSVNGVKEV